MGPRLARAEPGALRPRVVSALALAPFPIGAIWLGPPWLTALIAIAGAVMAWEWGRLCRREPVPGRMAAASGLALVGTVLAAIVAQALLPIAVALAIAVLGAAIVFKAAARDCGARPFWMAAGALWVALPCLSLLWLAEADGTHRNSLFWILALVWATDIGAYAIGRQLGGPRLAPRWSPRKTWAGLIGGTLCAAAVGWATARTLGISPAGPVILISAGLAIVEQFGDLAESVAKRRFGVKDSSGLIPGHGGFLDRLDGLLAVAPAVALLTLIGGGSVLTWR
ncbi:MAG: phosphatidate cytidylyltransferase [Alphaproteobacteria bacterium]|nr:phosphatidate cytidylyltransferase [Alphaproteobacteria bacterium]